MPYKSIDHLFIFSLSLQKKICMHACKYVFMYVFNVYMYVYLMCMFIMRMGSYCEFF